MRMGSAWRVLASLALVQGAGGDAAAEEAALVAEASAIEARIFEERLELGRVRQRLGLVVAVLALVR